MTQTQHVVLKGTREGLVLYLDPQVEFTVLLTELKNLLADTGRFFHNARVNCFSGGKTYSEKEVSLFQEVLAASHLEIGDWLEEDQVYVPGKPPLGFDEEKEKREVHHWDEGMEESNSRFIERTLRSGQSVRYPGHVIVYGDLNPGAEVIASGNIFVLGSLRGVAHAGAEGDRKASVSAYHLAPTQLRIADLVTRPPEDEETWRGPEVARIKDGSLVVEAMVINTNKNKVR